MLLVMADLGEGPIPSSRISKERPVYHLFWFFGQTIKRHSMLLATSTRFSAPEDLTRS